MNVHMLAYEVSHVCTYMSAVMARSAISCKLGINSCKVPSFRIIYMLLYGLAQIECRNPKVPASAAF